MLGLFLAVVLVVVVAVLSFFMIDFSWLCFLLTTCYWFHSVYYDVWFIDYAFSCAIYRLWWMCQFVLGFVCNICYVYVLEYLMFAWCMIMYRYALVLLSIIICAYLWILCIFMWSYVVVRCIVYYDVLSIIVIMYYCVLSCITHDYLLKIYYCI